MARQRKWMQATFVSLLFLSLSFPIAHAAFGFNFEVNQGLTSIDLEYGSSKQIPLKITSNNDWCTISCGVTTDSQYSDWGTITASQRLKSSYFTTYAPSRGVEGDSKTISISATCNQVDSATCDYIAGAPKTSLLTITYKLTAAQKQARDYVNSNLPGIIATLSNADIAIKKLEDKFSQLGSNVKTGNLRSDTATLRTQYSGFKREAENVKTLFEYPDYIAAQNSLRSTLGSDISKLTTTAPSLGKQLDSIIVKHNEVSKEIDELGTINTEIKNKLRILKEDSAITSEINNIVANFNSGNFISYDAIETEIDGLKQRARAANDELAAKIDAVKRDATNVFTKEHSSLCQKENICLTVSDIQTVEQSCSALNELSNKVYAENSRRNNEYLKAKNNVDILNSRIDSLNQKFVKLNEQLKNKKVDIAECNAAIGKVNAAANSDTAIEIKNGLATVEKICGSVETALSDETTPKKNILQKFFGLITGVLGGAKIKELKAMPAAKEPSTISLSNDVQSFISSKCSFSLEEIQKNYAVLSADVVEREIKGESIGHAIERDQTCTALGQTTPCCIGDACKTDPKTYPIIFVHGHSAVSWNTLDYSINAFGNLQQKLSSEGYVTADILLAESNINAVKAGDWGKINKPVTVKTSYYKGVYDEKTGKTIGKEPGQSIDVYSQRLSDIVDQVLHHTNKDKVIIVAHSMGGLVSRNYIKNYGGDKKVYKLITVGTPHHGVYNRVGALCGTLITGHLGLQECEDMQNGSSLIVKLNNDDETPGTVDYTSIIGSGCIYQGDTAEAEGDGVVRVSSATLEGATNIKVSGTCKPTLSEEKGDFHKSLTRNDEVIKYVLEELKQ